MTPLLLWASTAWAAELTDAEAERLARLYYQQLGRPVPTAFLADDIEALVDTGRTAQELERAVLYIVRNVEGADAYTLSGILESHLAAALDYEEELILPEGYDPDNVLGEVVEEPEGYSPGPAEVEALLVLYYEGTGRRAPDPALQADLAAFTRLTEDGWSREGVVNLVSFVPTNVRGSELLSFAEAVDVALDQGYLGGPRPRGGYDELQGVEDRMPGPADTWVVDRVPRRYDGGRMRTTATMGTLPAAIDGAAAELPGTELRVLEARVSNTAEGSTTTLTMAEAKAETAFVVEGLYSQVVPGRSLVDGLALDGAPAFEDGTGTTPFLLGGRASVARTITGFITVPGTAVGASAWGFVAAPMSEGGVSVSLKMGEDFRVTSEAGLGGLRQDVSDREVVGQLVWLDFSPAYSWDGGFVEASWRGRWNGGGLLDDAPPVFDDEWAEERHQVTARLGRTGDRWALGAGAGFANQSWSLVWVERQATAISFSGKGGSSTAAVFAGGEVNLRGDWWLSAGGQWVVVDGAGQPELSAGTRVLVRDWVWVQAEARVPREPQAAIGVAFPF